MDQTQKIDSSAAASIWSRQFPALGRFVTVMVYAVIGLSVTAQGLPSYCNLAKYQQATGSTTGYSFDAKDFATDGIASNFHRWRSTNAIGQTLDITFPRAVTIASAHLYNGVQGASNTELWVDFKFQYDNGGIWVDIPGGSRTGNSATEVGIIFTQAVTSNKFRLVNTESGSAVRSVRELAMFGPNLSGGVEQGYPIGTDVSCNLACRRPATASSINGANYALHAVDGFVDDSSRWLCVAGVAGEWLEIDLLGGNQWGDAYQAIGSAHLYSGDFATSSNALAAFTLEYWDTVNSVWAAIPGATITGNTQNIRTITFSSTVVTNKVRLVNNTTTAAKIAELRIFPPRSGGYPTGQNLRTESPPTSKWSDFSDATHHLRVSTAGLKLGLIGGNAIFTDDTAGTDALNWQVLLNHRDGSYRIRNVKTGMCLAQAQLSTAANTLVVGESYTGMPHQCWWLDRINSTQFRLINVYSGLALQSLAGGTTSGTALVVVSPGVSALQQWDAVWQANVSKKGIAATGSVFPDVPSETWMSYLNGKYQHTSWSYSWGLRDNFPYLATRHTFNPMQWGNFFNRGNNSTAPLEGMRVYFQSQGKPAHLLGFNEPDGVEQANMTVPTAIQRWPRLQWMDAPLVGPCPANSFFNATKNENWNQEFYAEADRLGYRVDYTPYHWYAGPSSSNLINKIKELHGLYGRPIWLTEFSCVRWSGTATWTHASTYNFLAEFMWRAENTPELARYSLFNWKREPTSLIDPVEAPRGNALDENGNLTPYGELYASWDNIAQVLPQKAYHLHNHGFYQRMRSPATGGSFDFVTPDISTAGTQWYLTAGTTSNTYRIRTTRDGRQLIRQSGSPAAMGALGQDGAESEWTLTPVVPGADHDGWYYLDHPLTNQRLKNHGDGTCSMVATTDTSNACKWRFIVPLVPEMKAVADSLTVLFNQQVLIDVLANDGGRIGKPAIQSVGTPNSGTAVLENGKIRYTPGNGFSGTVQFNYTIGDGTVTDTAQVTITVRPNEAPSVNAGADQTVLLDEVTAIAPVAGAWFEWDAANDVAGDNIWASTTSNTYTWNFDSGNQTPVNVTDSRFASISKAYMFPAAKDASNTSLELIGGNQRATFEFVIDIDGTNGSIFESGGAGTGMQVDIVNGVLRGTVSNSSTIARAGYTLTPTDLGRFIHVVVVADNVNDVVQLYVDGYLKDSQPWTLSNNWAGGNPGSLGAVADSVPPGGSTVEFNGKLALFRFHKNKAFTAGEVSTNYASAIGGRARTVSLDGTVTDADGDTVTTIWEVVSGPGAVVFGNTAAVDTTAIFTVTGNYVLRLTATDGITSTSDEVSITVGTAYQNWAIRSFSGLFTDPAVTSDPDGDRFNNLQEFAFGMDPTNPLRPAIAFTPGGELSQAGPPVLMNFASPQSPDYRAVFCRRKGHALAGLSYSVEFSADLALWTTSIETPLVLTSAAGSGEMEAVSVPYPSTVATQNSGNQAPRFFRVGVIGN